MKYFEYIKMQEDKDNPLKGQDSLMLISKNLKEEIYKDFYGRILS